MPRRTKIVATLGPATDDPKTLDELIAAGVDVVRLNMSHGSYEEHQRRAEWVRDRARASGRQVGVLIDLQGPKIRIARFENDDIKLAIGDKFIIDTAGIKRKVIKSAWVPVTQRYMMNAHVVTRCCLMTA